ncbi:3'-5' exonuclease [Crocosphaera chwakensis]|uniref:Exonuclease n=1 Tax=Crocosphaera chwakensis CCY0110 TaxID=391612 RepID=A3IY36_9CHRO|nr:exonuclease [Crocosphaera chwakensis]EAZ88612.1 exonuclease [Crocosphaera chwakensis CCY0110]
MSCLSTLLYVDSETKNNAFLINKIPIETTQNTVMQTYIIDSLQRAYQLADVVVAHNKDFDQPLILNSDWAGFWEKPWLCTYKDFELFPDAYPGKRDLISLAQFYGVGVNISHRAINDCLLLAEVFNRVPNLQEQFRIAQLPIIEAICSKSDEVLKEQGFKWNYDQQGWFKKDKQESFDFPVIRNSKIRHIFRAFVSYDERQIAKDWGFTWNSERKAWERLLSPEAIDLMPFPVVQLEKDSIDKSLATTKSAN